MVLFTVQQLLVPVTEHVQTSNKLIILYMFSANVHNGGKIKNYPPGAKCVIKKHERLYYLHMTIFKNIISTGKMQNDMIS